MKKWLDWFDYGEYRDFGGVNKSLFAKILIGVLDIIYFVYAWGSGLLFILLVLISGVYCLVTHIPRKKFGWPPLWIPPDF